MEKPSVTTVEQEEKREDVMNTRRVNEAAKTFGDTVARIDTLVDQLSLRALKRVLKATIKFPLDKSYPNFRKGSVEDELFISNLVALDTKRIMLEAFALSQQEQEELVVDPMVS